MNIDSINLADLSGVILGFSLTIFVFSYIVGDNPFFQLATHIFIGVAAGYATVVTLYNVILPQLVFPFLSDNKGEMILASIFIIPSVLLLAKISPRLSRLGNPAVAILVGIGAAAAIGGAVVGTVFPQVSISINLFENNNAINAVVLLVGTLTTLIYFHFGVRPDKNRSTPLLRIIRGLGWIGQVYIAITFGALFAGVCIAALTAFVERFTFIWSFIKEIL
ncbi:MAG: hypothetical protein U9Q82_02435 [Chloroflexota bacterium]|nr:hypothetical protein [Chloroflexota bacterium]